MFALSSVSNQTLRMELLHMRRDLSDHYNALNGDFYLSELYNWKVARFEALQAFANAHYNVTFIQQRDIYAANANAKRMANQRNQFNQPPKNKPKNKKKNRRNPNNAAPAFVANSTQRAIESYNNVVIKQEKVDGSNQPTVEGFGNVMREKAATSNERLENVGNIVIKQEKVDDSYQEFAAAITKSFQRVGGKRKCNNAVESDAKKGKSQ